ncbi:MAG: SPOR domain-containing protein [Bacteroidota bacterium]
MPDLNLQDDEGTQENPEGSGEHDGEMTETAPSEEAQEENGGGMMKILIIIAGILILGGGTVFLLNSLGVIKLWGGAPETTVMEYEEPAPAETTEGQQPDAVDESAQTKMVETPALDEKQTAKPAGSTAAKSQFPAQSMPAPAGSGKLSEMHGEYTVQVSAWREEGTAKELVQRLEEAGYPAFVESRPYADGSWYTVRIGRYGSRKDAQLAVASFAEELQSNHWIDKVRNR